MISRRSVLKALILSTGAAALPSAFAADTASAAPESEGVFKLPPLGYDYDALEPYIDGETMKLHHDKHHASYVSRLNQAVEKLPVADRKSVEELLAHLDRLPEELRQEVRNQGGGHANHSFFWQMLRKSEAAKPVGELGKEIVKSFGSYDDFWKLLTGAAMGVFGSGWSWLVWRDRKLVVEATANQDSPLLTGGVPLIGIDVWEHAYYLKYQNRRAEYVAAFANLINWEWANDRFGKYQAIQG
jgi:Fe-Mn family superoxide dismutase